jgi:hypothetical protein
MEILYKGVPYWVKFFHLRKDTYKGVTYITDHACGTKCIIEYSDGNGKQMFAEGISKVSHGDAFNKKIGKRKAFDRAIRQVFPDNTSEISRINGYWIERNAVNYKETRKLFWEAYFNCFEYPESKRKNIYGKSYHIDAVERQFIPEEFTAKEQEIVLKDSNDNPIDLRQVEGTIFNDIPVDDIPY